jgi:hypothetical protein
VALCVLVFSRESMAMQEIAPLATAPAVAGAPPSAAADSAVAAPPVPAALPCACLAIAALTPIKIELLETVSSRTSIAGTTFKIALKDAIVVDGAELVPAGTPGFGEVVHARKSGASGTGGELVVAARYLDLGGQHIRLRSMMLSSTGKDNTVLAAAAAQAISFLAFVIRGKNTEFPAGSIANAKIAELVWITKPVMAAKPEPSIPVVPSTSISTGVTQ